MGDGLIERLNAEECIGVGAAGQSLVCLTNPDGPEAASRIAELEAKLATAVGALEEADQRLSRPDWTVQRDKTRMSIRSSLACIQERT